MIVIRQIACALVLTLGFAMPTHAFETVGFGVTGGDEDLEDRLQAASLVIAARREDTQDPQDILAAARSDYARMVGVLYDNGYFGPVVSIRVDGREAAEISPLFVPDRIERVDIRISTGPRFRFGDLSVAPLAPGTELPESFRRGEVARTPVIARAGRSAIRGWRDIGYAKADVTAQEITAKHEESRLSARLGVTPGPRVSFGRLNITGNEDVRTERIRQIAGLPTGEVFSPDEAERVQANLRRTRAFRSTVLTEGEVGSGNVMDMDLVVSEALPRRIGYGIEYSNTDGIELSGYFIHRNLTGAADTLELNFDVEGIGSNNRDPGTTLSARYTIPAYPRSDTDFFVLGQVALLDERDFSGQSAELGFGFVRRFSERLTGEVAVGLNYANIDDAFGNSEYWLIQAPSRLIYDGRDDFLDPTDGYFVDSSLTPFLALSGTSSGARFLGDARLYKGLGNDDRIVLAARGQLGSIVGPGLSETPNYFLFYSGGGGTVRGQEYQSLGVDLGGGLRTGGRSFLGASGEIRGRVSDNIQLVGFYDWGYIGSESFVDGTGDSHSGAGLGVRYITPIGPLRVDVATPISGTPGGGSLLLYIGIGQAW